MTAKLFALVAILINLCAEGQIVQIGSFQATNPNAVRLVRTLPSVGQKLMTYSNTGFTLYNLDGGLHLDVVYPEPPVGYLWPSDGPWYVTESLFDLDATTIEFMITAPALDAEPDAIAVLRADGTLLFWGVGKFPLASPLGPMDMLTASPWVFNTPQGAIMALRSIDAELAIYQLPGSLPCLECDGTVSESGSMLGDTEHANDILSPLVFPNPASSHAEVVFGTSGDDRVRALVLVDLQGAVVKRLSVPSGVARMTVSVSDVAAGVYAYRLETDLGEVRGSRLLIVR